MPTRKKIIPEAEVSVPSPAPAAPAQAKTAKAMTVNPSRATAPAAAPKRHKKATPAPETPSAPLAVDPAEVSRLAYFYWVERNYRHGAAVDDWVRAEQELRARVAAG